MIVIRTEHPNEVVLAQHVAGDPEQVIETAEGARLWRWAMEESKDPVAYNHAYATQWNRQLRGEEWLQEAL